MIAATRSHDLRIRLFGGPEIKLSGQSRTALLWKKSQGILAYLSIESGIAQPREKIAQVFWPELSREAARSNLRQALLNLQRTLGKGPDDQPWWKNDPRTICFQPGPTLCLDVLDFIEFKQRCISAGSQKDCSSCLLELERCTALYTEEFMAGFYLENCPEFEDWLQIQRETLHRRALMLLERAALCHEEAQAPERALTFALRYTELDPWNEGGHRRLMRLLNLNGQHAAAQHQYRRCCQILRDQLGVVPSVRTRELARRIEEHDLPPERETVKPTLSRPEMLACATERRQVTVLFCSMTPTRESDPEDMLELLKAPQSRCLDLVRDFSGHAVLTHDGGVLGYFGYPEASEQAAVLAVRAALAVNDLHFQGLELRTGIHTGLVITQREPERPDTVGKTTAAAIYLRMKAKPGEVLISPELHALVAGYAQTTPLPEHEATKIQGQGPQSYRLLGLSGASHRLEAGGRLTPLVGRKDELRRLEGLWKKACHGHPRQLLIQGDPGIGKSRLIHQLRQQVLSQGEGTIQELRCLPELTHSPFAPLRGLFNQILECRPGDPDKSRFSALVRYVRSRYPQKDAEVVPLLAALLSLPLFEPYRPLSASPRDQREQTMALLIDRLVQMASERPLMLIVEDMHWIDPTTQELLLRFLSQVVHSPTLVLLTARPEYACPDGSPDTEILQLEPLDEAQIRTLVEQRLHCLSPRLVEQVVQRADGVPLFAEELSRILSETSIEQNLSAIPFTLQDLLAARLDSLGEARLTARLAATIGREFCFELLSKLSPLDIPGLTRALRQLVQAGLLGELANGEYYFRHSLFQDAAYQSQPRAERRLTHGKIAEVLENHFPQIRSQSPECLARHWAAANEPCLAATSWLEAARKASLQSADSEALIHLHSGLKLLEGLEQELRPAQLELDLQVGLGWALVAKGGFASEAAGEAFNRAIELSAQQGTSTDSFHALWGIWTSASSRWGNRRAEELGETLLSMATQGRDPVQLQQAHFALGNTQFWQGRFVKSRHHLQQAVLGYASGQHDTHIACFGENGGVSSRSYLSWTLWFMGYPDQARLLSEQALCLAEEVNHPFSLAYGLTFAMVLHRHLREPVKTLELADRVLALARTHDFPLWEAGARLKRGWARVMLGQPDGLDEMQQSIETMRSAMSGLNAIFQETLADALCHLQHFDQAQEQITQALEDIVKSDDHHAEAELYRLRAKCLLQGEQGRQAEAQQALLEAIRISEAQQARVPRLRSTAALAQLLHSQGRDAEALPLLEECYRGFTEGFDTHDLRKAAQILEGLRPGLASSAQCNRVD